MIAKIEEVTGQSGEILGYEAYDDQGNLIEFIPYQPTPNVGDLLDDTCCGCGGCFQKTKEGE